MAEDIHNRILSDRIELNKGMLVENVVAQMFRAAGHKLYFYAGAEENEILTRPYFLRRGAWIYGKICASRLKEAIEVWTYI